MLKKIVMLNFKTKIELFVLLFVSKFFNNGWRKYLDIKEIEKKHSFNALPKTSCYYDVVVKGEIQYRYYYGGCISSDAWVDKNVTHFRFSKTYKLPKW